MSHVNVELVTDVSKISVSIIRVNPDDKDARDLGDVGS
jgi:hypothetical protein